MNARLSASRNDERHDDGMVTTHMTLLQLLKTVWHWIREATGENDYQRYRARALARGESPLLPSAFYASRLERKYSRPNRCC